MPAILCAELVVNAVGTIQIPLVCTVIDHVTFASRLLHWSNNTLPSSMAVEGEELRYLSAVCVFQYSREGSMADRYCISGVFSPA